MPAFCLADHAAEWQSDWTTVDQTNFDPLHAAVKSAHEPSVHPTITATNSNAIGSTIGPAQHAAIRAADITANISACPQSNVEADRPAHCPTVTVANVSAIKCPERTTVTAPDRISYHSTVKCAKCPAVRAADCAAFVAACYPPDKQAHLPAIELTHSSAICAALVTAVEAACVGANFCADEPAF